MRKFLVLMAVVMLVVSTGSAFARVNPEKSGTLDAMQALDKSDFGIDNSTLGLKDIPPDTLDFGFFTTKLDGKKYAVLGGKWTWDNPQKADPLEGWTDVDLTAQLGTFFRHMTADIWATEANGDPAPAMNGAGFALCGTTKQFADDLAWGAGLGYGDNFCQLLTSPTYNYDGSGAVDLSFAYFTQSETNYDYTYVNIVTAGGNTYDVTNYAFTGPIGIDEGTGAITPAAFAYSVSNSNFGGGTTARNFNVVVNFKSDGGWSDEDAGVDTWYGPFGMDDFTIGPANLDPAVAYAYNFEADLQGWVPGVCPGVGSYFGVAQIGVGYNILDPCPCSLTGNVVKMHDEFQAHPDGQHVMLYTPIIDRLNDIPSGNYLAYNRVFADYDQYADLPTINGVFYRGGWSYYPYTNPVTGNPMWSPRVGIGTFYYAGGNPACQANRNIGTDWGLPTDTQQLKFIYELYASCAAFGQVPCSGTTNFSPLLDNLRVRNTGRILAPVSLFKTGTKLQDGFGQSAMGVLSTADPGNANIVYDLRRLTAYPSRLGDSLVVEGPNPVPGVASTRWEAKLWFRLNRTGPGQTSNATYTTWHDAVAGAKGEFVGASANFAWGYMDSVESGTSVKSQSRYRFCSRFRDGPSTGGFMLPADVNYSWGGTGEFGNGNAILPDGAFTPGTKVQYYVTNNYVATPDAYEYYPDITGGNYYEFEILPSFRMDPPNDPNGTPKFPCMLYIDSYDGRGNPEAQVIIEKALNIKINGLLETDPIPDPTNWDRYDYGDASSNWNASFYRQVGGMGGATIPQMLGYKLIMVNTGILGVGAMEPRDWQGFQQWLEGALCDGNINRQGFIANGNTIHEVINTDYPSFLTRNLGAIYGCRSQNEEGCPSGELQNDQNYCTKLGQIPGYFAAGIPTDVWANWCPSKVSYGILAANTAVPTAAANKYYEKIGAPGVIAEYAQVLNDRLSAADKYRTVIDGFSYHMMIKPNTSPIGTPLSAYDCRYLTTAEQTSARIGAAAKELENAITWTMGTLNPGLCVNPCLDTNSAPDQEGASAAMTRLYQNHPNPFNPRTAIRFSLAADGPAKLVIYDVNGRRIRTLVDNGLKAGMHEVVWDGTDDAGRTVTSGVYWSQLQAGDYSSNKKMVVLK